MILQVRICEKKGKKLNDNSNKMLHISLQAAQEAS